MLGIRNCGSSRFVAIFDNYIAIIPILNGELVLSLNYQVEDTQTKMQPFYHCGQKFYEQKHKVNDPKTTPRYATITSDENNKHGYDFPLRKHYGTMHFHDCNTSCINSSHGRESIQITLIEAAAAIQRLSQRNLFSR